SHVPRIPHRGAEGPAPDRAALDRLRLRERRRAPARAAPEASEHDGTRRPYLDGRRDGGRTHPARRPGPPRQGCGHGARRPRHRADRGLARLRRQRARLLDRLPAPHRPVSIQEKVTPGEARALLADYAYTLDAGRLAQWPTFFTERGLYRITTRQNHERGYPLSIMLCDNRNMLYDRVEATEKANIFEP